MSKSEI